MTKRSVTPCKLSKFKKLTTELQHIFTEFCDLKRKRHGICYPDGAKDEDSDIDSDSSNDVSVSDMINSPDCAQCIAAKLAKLEINQDFMSPLPKIVTLNDVMFEFDDSSKTDPLQTDFDVVFQGYSLTNITLNNLEFLQNPFVRNF